MSPPRSGTSPTTPSASASATSRPAPIASLRLRPAASVRPKRLRSPFEQPWEDTRETERVAELAPLDLVLFNRTADPSGAHVGVYLGAGRVIHLAQRVGKPAVWPLERFAREPGYEIFIGAKRVRRAPTGSS